MLTSDQLLKLTAEMQAHLEEEARRRGVDVSTVYEEVDVEVADPRGQNKKRRPVVVLTATDELLEADTFVVAAVSTQFSQPLPPDWIPLPWSSDGKARSGLLEPCVVKCHWLRKVTRRDVVSIRGWLPSALMQQIMQVLCQG